MINLLRDFGAGFVLSPLPQPLGEAEMNAYQSGTRRDLPEDFRGCHLALFTGGVYPTVLRLSRDIPTFDSGDREYDAWHDLYLVRERSGRMHAVYCAGGYRIAEAKRYHTLLAYPPALARYFREPQE